jgi:hypothetical protein
MMKRVADALRAYRRRVALLGALLLANVVLLAFVAVSQEPDLAHAREERRALLALLGSASAKGSAGAVKDNRRDLEKLRGLIQAKRDFPALLEQMMASASTCGVVMGPVAYKPTTLKEKKLLAYELTLSVSGRYGAVKAFLFDLQILEGLSAIDGITLTCGDPYAEKVTMDARITVYLKDDA